MLKIGDFSKLSRISIRMLRHYDEIQLLVPKTIDESTGYRYYSESQLPVANRITSLKDMGFSLLTICKIIQIYSDSPKLKQYLVLKQSEILEQAKKTNRQLLLLNNTLNKLGKDEAYMNYNVTIKELPERTVASVRKTIPSYDHEGTLWNILMCETSQLNMQDGNPCYTLAIFHDKEYKESNVDVEVQKSVKGKYKNTKNVLFKTVAPVLIASATYKGSYDQVSDVNLAVANWIRDNGYEIDGLNFNIYHISPHETQNPKEWVTEVCFPVKKK